MVKQNLSDNLQNKNFKISICFFSLQGKPALLVPWMVYIIAFVIVLTFLYFLVVVGSFATGNTVHGAAFTIGLVIYFRK
jgi:hypothetical protein